MAINKFIEEELTPEGKKMFDAIADHIKLLQGESVLPKEKKQVIRRTQAEIKSSLKDLEINFLRREIARMIKNSELVIIDCNKILDKVKDIEEYLKADVKVAKSIHTNLIIRLNRVLDGEPAFDHEVKLDDE